MRALLVPLQHTWVLWLVVGMAGRDQVRPMRKRQLVTDCTEYFRVIRSERLSTFQEPSVKLELKFVPGTP